MSEERKKWTVQFNDGQWAPAVVVNPWLPTTRNYFAADAVAKRANQVKLKWTEWTRVFDMIREMDARLAEAANERASRAEVEPGSATTAGDLDAKEHGAGDITADSGKMPGGSRAVVS